MSPHRSLLSILSHAHLFLLGSNSPQMYHNLTSALAGLLLVASSGLAITFDTKDTSSVTKAAKIIVDRIASTYDGNQPGKTPGLFTGRYYWWESGLAWDSMVNYWAQTGDDSYNNIINEALSWQVGPGFDYLPPNQTKSIGNDDQSFWGLAAMTAAEHGFPAPAGSLVEGTDVTWVQLAVNVFNGQIARWDQETCRGGLRWQIFTFNSGHTYKNSMSNGNLYQLASRLALYTGNSTYGDWAEKVLQWSYQIALLDRNTGAVYDGSDATTNCSNINRVQWTSNAGTYLSGAAHSQNYVRTAPPPEYDHY